MRSILVSLLLVLSFLFGCGSSSSNDSFDCEPGFAGPNCSSCQVGTYCAGGDAAPVTCEFGTWDHDANPATECQSWSSCPAGRYITTDGGPTEDRRCAACEEGTFTSAADQTQCRPFSNCAPGEFEVEAGSRSSDRVCSKCEGNTFAPQLNASSCQPLTDCQPGQYISIPASATNDRLCATCIDGFSLRIGSVKSAKRGSTAMRRMQPRAHRTRPARLEST